MSFDVSAADFRRDIHTYYDGDNEEKNPFELKIWKYKVVDGVGIVRMLINGNTKSWMGWGS
jgi:hypothetical protein